MTRCMFSNIPEWDDCQKDAIYFYVDRRSKHMKLKCRCEEHKFRRMFKLGSNVEVFDSIEEATVCFILYL